MDVKFGACKCVDEMTIKANVFYNIGLDEIVDFKDLGMGKSFSQH